MTAKEYFVKYLGWKTRIRDDENNTNVIAYESYAAMDLDMLQSEADDGNAGAMEELGERYLFGLADRTNIGKAIELLNRAAELGNPDAMSLLADVLRSDDYGMKNLDLYFEVLEQAARWGSWKAQFNLACACYKGREGYEGHGPEADKEKALYWSMQGAVTCMDLLQEFCTRPCSNGFSGYLDTLYSTFSSCVTAAAGQLIRGDGVPQDIGRARMMLNDVQAFTRRYSGGESTEFKRLLMRCDQAEGKTVTEGEG